MEFSVRKNIQSWFIGYRINLSGYFASYRSVSEKYVKCFFRTVKSAFTFFHWLSSKPDIELNICSRCFTFQLRVTIRDCTWNVCNLRAIQHSLMPWVNTKNDHRTPSAQETGIYLSQAPVRHVDRLAEPEYLKFQTR